MNDRSPCPSAASLELAADGVPVDAALSAHIDTCTQCREFLSEIKANQAFVAAYLTAGGGPIAATVRDELLEVPAGMVPGYRLTRELHRGGQGVVYHAIQERTRREVAIKMLLAGAFATQKQRARFELEAELAARLRHPGIVTVHDTVPLARGRYAIVMEYVGGVPLDEWTPPVGTARDRRDAWLRLFVSICDAVQYAHHRQVAHRDLKPANIVVTPEGQPKVLDFGIAKAVGEAGATVTDEFVGTLAYASPEQLTRNSDRVDTRTDIYSLGVMLYERLTGRRPFAVEGSVAEILQKMSDREPVAPSRAGGPLPLSADADAVLLRALRFDPAERYQTAVGLGRDLEHLLHGTELAIKRDNSLYVLRKRLRRHRRGIAVACAVLAVMVGALVIAVRERTARRSAAEQHARAEDEARRAEAVAYILGDLVTGDSVNESAADRELVSRLGQVQSKLETGSLYDNPRLEVEVQRTMALLSRRLGHNRGWPAENASRRGVLLAQQLDGPESARAARAYVDLAQSLLARERFEESVQACRESLRVQATLGLPGRELRGTSYDVLARALIGLGDLPGAERACESAAAAWADSDNSLLRSGAFDTRARILVARADWAGALASCGEALRMRFLACGDDAPEVVSSLRQAAGIVARASSADVENDVIVRALGGLGPLEAGAALVAMADAVREPSAGRAECLRQLREIKRAMFGDQDFESGETAGLVGRSLSSAGNLGQSRPYLTEYTSAMERRFGQGALPTAIAYETMAGIEYNSHSNLAAARWMEKACDIWAAQSPGPNTDFLAALKERDTGRIFGTAGDHEAAARYLRSAVDRLERAGGSGQYAAALCLAYLAKSEVACGRLSDAGAAARRACDIERTNRAISAVHRAEIWLAMGLVLDREGRTQEAAVLVEECLKGWGVPIPDDCKELPDYLTAFEILARHARDRADPAAMESWNARLPPARRIPSEVRPATVDQAPGAP